MKIVTMTPTPYMKKGIVSGDQQNRLGVAVRTLDDREKQRFHIEDGVVITDVVEDQSGDDLGIQPGDIILKVNCHRIQSVVAFYQILAQFKKGEIMRLYIRRGGGNLFVATRIE